MSESVQLALNDFIKAFNILFSVTHSIATLKHARAHDKDERFYVHFHVNISAL